MPAPQLAASVLDRLVRADDVVLEVDQRQGCVALLTTGLEHLAEELSLAAKVGDADFDVGPEKWVLCEPDFLEGDNRTKVRTARLIFLQLLR